MMQASRSVSAPLRQLPNALTILRFVAIPVFVVVLLAERSGPSWLAGVVFGAAAITDQVDGWLARRWGVESEFGKFADPLADRLMIDIAVILLFAYDRLPWPALVLIVIRDGLLVLGTPFALRQGYDFSVSFLGKAATWVLYASIAFILVTEAGTDWPLWLFWSGVALASLAGILYGVAVWKAVRE
jgi:CDP-diacylglycerol--glycerol-3-phosphate 3-phosphatidyltransferase